MDKITMSVKDKIINLTPDMAVTVEMNRASGDSLNSYSARY